MTSLPYSLRTVRVTSPCFQLEISHRLNDAFCEILLTVLSWSMFLNKSGKYDIINLSAVLSLCICNYIKHERDFKL